MVKSAKITISTVTAEKDSFKLPNKWKILDITFSQRLQQKTQENEESIEFKKWKATVFILQTDLIPHKVNSQKAV